jgi:hypothetical protein
MVFKPRTLVTGGPVYYAAAKEIDPDEVCRQVHKFVNVLCPKRGAAPFPRVEVPRAEPRPKRWRPGRRHRRMQHRMDH